VFLAPRPASTQCKDCAGEAAVGDQLERRGGGGVIDMPHGVQRFQCQPDSIERVAAGGEVVTAFGPARPAS